MTDLYTPTPLKPYNYEDVTFSMDIKKLLVKDVGDRKDIVYSVEWALVGDDGTRKVACDHSITFQDFELEKSPSFTFFSDLSKEQVEDWIRNKVPMLHLEYTVCNNFPKLTVEPSKELPWV